MSPPVLDSDRILEGVNRVAAGTGGVSWTKRAADVTAFASYIGMCTVQDKTGTEVIEGCLRTNTCCCEQTENSNRDQDQIAASHFLKNIHH